MGEEIDNIVLSDGLQAVFQGWKAEVDAHLVSVAQQAGAGSELLSEAALYVVQGAGKRLRALLILSITRDILGSDGDLSDALRCAVSVEAIHAASLVHDDLPALDNDDYRRGRPSAHRAFNEATAILVGDLLVGAAFKALSTSPDRLTVRTRLCELLAQSWIEVCVGQQLDLHSDRDPVRRKKMVELKTGALFGFSAGSAAICAGCSDKDVQRLIRLGVRIGVLFQRLDDATDGDSPNDEVISVESERETILEELQSCVGREIQLSSAIVRQILTANS